MQEGTVKFGQWVVARRWLVLFLSLVAVALAGAGAPNLSFSSSYRVFFGEDNPQLAAHDALEDTYTKVDNVVFAFKWRDGEVFTPERLRLLREATDMGWQMPFAIRVDSLTNYQHAWADGDDLIVRDLVDSDVRADNPDDLAEIRKIALAERATKKRLIAPNAETAAIVVTIQTPPGSEAEIPVIAAEARKLRDHMQAKDPDLRVAMTGVVMLSNSFLEAGRRDIETLVPLMFGVLGITMLIFLRSFTSAGASMIVVLLSVVATMGIAGHLGFQLSPSSSIVPVIVLTIAVADSIHIISTVYRDLWTGSERRAAVIESLRVNMSPVFLTSATTAIGFLSLNFSDAPPIQDLGSMSAIGAVVAWALSITMLPALLAILPIKKRKRGALEHVVIERVGELVITRGRRIVLIMGVALVGLSTLIPTLHINDRFVEYFSERLEFRQDSDFISANLPGVYFLEFSVPSGAENGITKPEYLARVDAFSNWLESQPEVVHVSAFSDVIKRVNRSMNGDDPAFYALPTDGDLAAQYLLLYEFSLPFGLDLNNQIDVAKSSTRVTAILDNISSTEMKEVRFRAEDWLAGNVPPENLAEGTGVSILFAFLTQRNIESMIVGTGVALFLISACLIFALRSLKMGLLSLIPNIVPPVLAFGVWAIVKGDIGMYAASVVATALGLIVDFTVHFLSKYLRARRERGQSPEDSVRHAFATVGTALWVSAFVLVAGFATLGLSDFVMNSYLGIMTALIIVIALIVDFLLLPAIILIADKDKEKPSAEPIPAS